MDFDVIGFEAPDASRPGTRRVDDNIAVVNRPVVNPNTRRGAIFNYDRIDRRAFEQMRARSGRRTRVRLRELAIVDAPIVAPAKRIPGPTRARGLTSSLLGRT